MDRTYHLCVNAVHLLHHICVQTRLEEGCWRGAYLNSLTNQNATAYFILRCIWSEHLIVKTDFNVPDQALVRAGVQIQEDKEMVRMENTGRLNRNIFAWQCFVNTKYSLQTSRLKSQPGPGQSYCIQLWEWRGGPHIPGGAYPRPQ